MHSLDGSYAYGMFTHLFESSRTQATPDSDDLYTLLRPPKTNIVVNAATIAHDDPYALRLRTTP